MSTLQYSIVGGDEKFITVFIPGRDTPLIARDTHPNFEQIVLLALQDDATVADLFDLAETIGRRFERLSERVSAENGLLYFDGDEQDDAIAKQVVRFLDEDVEDWKPLVAFMENVAANPTEHSRVQLYDWLNAREFTITEDGLIIGYKGVTTDNEGDLVSVHSGSASVDGDRKTGRIPNPVGSTVEMPRASVAHNPSEACSFGLHVANYSYAKGWGSTVVKVHVNPRDVVSVPTDGAGDKVRTCRYTVVEVVTAPSTGPVEFGSVEAEPYHDDYGYDEDADPFPYEDQYGQCFTTQEEADESDAEIEADELAEREADEEAEWEAELRLDAERADQECEDLGASYEPRDLGY